MRSNRYINLVRSYHDTWEVILNLNNINSSNEFEYYVRYFLDKVGENKPSECEDALSLDVVFSSKESAALGRVYYIPFTTLEYNIFEETIFQKLKS